MARLRTNDEVVSSKACEASVAQTSSLGCMTEPMPRTPKASLNHAMSAANYA